VELANCGYAAVEFRKIIFSVVYPNLQPFEGLFAQQISAGRHCDALDHVHSGLGETAWPGRAADCPPLGVTARNPHAMRKQSRIEIRERLYNKRTLCFLAGRRARNDTRRVGRLLRTIGGITKRAHKPTCGVSLKARLAALRQNTGPLVAVLNR